MSDELIRSLRAKLDEAERENARLRKEADAALSVLKRKDGDILAAWDDVEASRAAIARKDAALRAVRVNLVESLYDAGIPADCDDPVLAAIDAALTEPNCPYPAKGRPDNLMAGSCVDAGECGCMFRPALTEPTEKRDAGPAAGEMPERALLREFLVFARSGASFVYPSGSLQKLENALGDCPDEGCAQPETGAARETFVYELARRLLKNTDADALRSVEEALAAAQEPRP